MMRNKLFKQERFTQALNICVKSEYRAKLPTYPELSTMGGICWKNVKRTAAKPARRNAKMTPSTTSERLGFSSELKWWVTAKWHYSNISLIKYWFAIVFESISSCSPRKKISMIYRELQSFSGLEWSPILNSIISSRGSPWAKTGPTLLIILLSGVWWSGSLSSSLSLWNEKIKTLVCHDKNEDCLVVGIRNGMPKERLMTNMWVQE